MDSISILKKCDSLVYFVLRFVIMGDSKEIEKILSDGTLVCVCVSARRRSRPREIWSTIGLPGLDHSTRQTGTRV